MAESVCGRRTLSQSITRLAPVGIVLSLLKMESPFIPIVITPLIILHPAHKGSATTDKTDHRSMSRSTCRAAAAPG